MKIIIIITITTTTTTTTTNSSNNKNNKWNSGMKKLFSQTKIGIVNSNNNKNNESSSSVSSSYQNPYPPKQEILEYDWTDAPQIMNTNTDNGRMALVDTEGHTTNYYKNEATYQLSTKTTEIADQLKTTTSNFSQQFSHWKRSPFLLGMSTMNNNSNNNNNNNDQKTGRNNVTHHEQQRQQQDGEQQTQKNQSVQVATTNNNQEPEPRSSATTTTTTRKYKFMPSSITFPTLLPRSLLSKEQPPQLSTIYCDRNGNEPTTLVEENRRQASHTRMNIYY